MIAANFDRRRRELRTQLHENRVSSCDTTKERVMADAVVLDEILLAEFGSLPKTSTWLLVGNGGRLASEAYAERLKVAGAYVGLGEARWQA